ncbi:hypothetical protein Sjap_024212 [Stephania japonica]|uniref:Uncharacterized protein n=1 Tax=Stephania japonica TaxID=461633 RepID=A0AAP0HPX5_9MAGN
MYTFIATCQKRIGRIASDNSCQPIGTCHVITLVTSSPISYRHVDKPSFSSCPAARSASRCVQVEVCGLCRDYTHPTDVCPYEPEYESYPYWEYSSVTQRFHQDILLHQENMEQHFKVINSNLQSIETLTSKMNDTLNRMLEEEEFLVLLSCDEKETLKDVTLMSVEANDHATNEHFAIDGLTPCICEYLSDHEESEGELEVSQLEPEIIMAQTYEEEAEKEIEVTLTRPEELQ